MSLIDDDGKYHDPLHVPSARLVVKYKDKEMHLVNKRLLDQQNCWENLDKIKELHVKRYELFDALEATTDVVKLRELDKQCEEVEFELQDLWKFERDRNFHRFWDRPKCVCPKMDNNDRYPSGHYVVRVDCPLHGGFDE